MKVKCKAEKENNDYVDPSEIEVISIKFENVLEVDFLIKDIGCHSKTFEDTVKLIASFINPDSQKYNQEVAELLSLSKQLL